MRPARFVYHVAESRRRRTCAREAGSLPALSVDTLTPAIAELFHE